MNAPHYPLEDFLRDIDIVNRHLEAEKERAAPEPEVDGSVPFGWSIVHMNEALKPLYPNWSERFHKGSRVMLALNFISTHMADFDREDFAVYGSEKVGALV